MPSTAKKCRPTASATVLNRDDALKTKTGLVYVLAGVLGAGLGCAAFAQPATSRSDIYSCTDKNGRRLTSDRPIAECIDREQRELSPTGTVRRVIGPTLSENERALVEVQRRKDLEERQRIEEDRRRDRVLLARYPNKAAHDAERAQALTLVDDVKLTVQKRIVELQERRGTLDQEMEFYRKDPHKAPMHLQRKVLENAEELTEQQRFLAAQDQEKKRIHQRFDEELAQLKQLWAARSPAAAQAGAAVLPPPATRSAPAASR